MKKDNKRMGFIVIMKRGTSSKETGKLMEEVLKSKYVQRLEGRIILKEKKNDKRNTNNKR